MSTFLKRATIVGRSSTKFLTIVTIIVATAGSGAGATPSGQIWQPASPAEAGQFQRLEFFMIGADPDNDLRHCEMYVDSVRKGSAYFNTPNNGATARWTYAFGTSGTHTVSFKPVDAANHVGAEVAWTVNVTNSTGSLTLYAMTYNTHLFGGSSAERLCSVIAGWPWTTLGWNCDLSNFLFDDLNRRERIAYKVESSGMDIVALQEVWEPSWQQWFVDRLRYEYPHSIYVNSFCDSWLANANTLGNGLILLSKWPLTPGAFKEFPTYFPSVQVTEADKSDHWANKGILTATVDAAGPVRVGLTHALTGTGYSDYKSKWSTDYIANDMTTFQLNGKAYMFSVDRSNRGYISRFEDYGARGAGWKQIHTNAWGSDHIFVVSFQIQGPLDSSPHPYLFGVNGRNEGHIERINDDPATGWTTINYGPWGSDHVAVTSFQMQGPLDSSPHPYLFGVNGSNLGHIERINDDPATGWTHMSSAAWGSDHVVVTSFQMQGPLDSSPHPYLFGVNGRNEGHIDRINDDPTTGWTTIKYGPWHSNYRIVAPFHAAGVPYLFTLDKDGTDPNGYIFQIGPDPANGWINVHSAAWDSERIDSFLSYVAVKSFEVDGHPYLFALKNCCDHMPCPKVPLIGVPTYPSRCDPCERGLPGEAYLKRIRDIPTNGWTNLWQFEDIKMIRDESFVNDSPPTIVLGDFNIDENEYEVVDPLMRKAGAIDAYVAVHGTAVGGDTISSNNTLLTYFFGAQPSSRIDYVYVKQSGAGRRLDPVNAVVFRDWTYAVGPGLMDLSDHYPLMVEFRLQAGEGPRLAISRVANGWQLSTAGDIGRSYELQYSPDLNTWQKLVEFRLTSSPHLYIDSTSPNPSVRFYRVLLLP